VIVVPDEGEIVLMDWMLSDGPADLVLHLYKNDYTPHRESVVTDFTEADFVDYASVTLTVAGWQPAVLDMGAAQKKWGSDFLAFATSGTSQVIYGYYVTTADGLTLVWAERFPAPQTVTVTSPAMLWPLLRGHSEVEPAP
jgi:hypothetical protein